MCTGQIGKSNLQASERVFKCQVLSTVALGRQGQGDGSEDHEDGDREYAEAGHGGLCILSKEVKTR